VGRARALCTAPARQGGARAAAGASRRSARPHSGGRRARADGGGARAQARAGVPAEMRNATANARAVGSTPEDPILESSWDVFPVAIKDAPLRPNASITWASFANQSDHSATFDVSSNVVAPYVQLDSTLPGRRAPPPPTPPLLAAPVVPAGSGHRKRAAECTLCARCERGLRHGRRRAAAVCA
jgi:hypothetical protein